MDRNFNKSLQLVLKSEGGFVNIKADPGGATNRGITIANFRAYIKPNGTIEDLKNLTAEQAAVCYRKQYWDAVLGAELPDGVDYAVFDFAVNSGPSRAAKYLQAVVGVPQDGRIGPATVAAVKAKPAGVVIDALCDARLAFLKRLPTWGTFGKGWQSRVESVRKASLMMSQPSIIPDKPSVVVITPHDDGPPTITVTPAPAEPVLVPTKTKSNRNSFIVLIIMAVSALLAWLGVH